MQLTKLLPLILLASVMLFTGCATTELQTQAKMSNSIFINPVKKSERIIFVDVKNTSGQNINLQPAIEQMLIARGYQLTDDPDSAQYILLTNVLFANNKKENNSVGGAFGGGITGAVLAGNSSGGDTALVAIGGAIVGGLIASSMEDTIFQMVVDVVVREKTDQNVYTSNNNANRDATIRDTQGQGFTNSFAGESRSTEGRGTMNSGALTQNEQSYSTNYIESKTRIFAEAVKQDFTLDVALPILEQKIATQISGIF